MIREYAPIGLIPAAWIMTFVTVIEPGIDTYWIRHMHYFMLVFLTGFTVVSWRRMGNNNVLDIWRKIIVLGIISTLAGAISFSISAYGLILSGASLGYWLIAPSIGTYLSSKNMNNYVREYRAIGLSGLVCLALTAAGFLIDSSFALGAGLTIVAVSQTYSIVLAARMDGNM